MGKKHPPGENAQGQPEGAGYATVDQDTAWKDLLKEHFPDFLRFFFPAVADQVDLETPPEFLDAELKRFSRGNEAPRLGR